MIHRINRLAAIAMLATWSKVAEAVPIDLSGFDTFPPGAVSVAGNRADIVEDGLFSVASLENFSFLVPETAAVLSFGYSLTVPDAGFDFFDFYLGDAGVPVFSDGGFDATFTGNPAFDLTTYRGMVVPVIFALVSFDTDLTSTLTISDVALTHTVREPASISLLLAGLALIGLRVRAARGRRR